MSIIDSNTEKVFRLFKIEIVCYLSSIYDLYNLSLTCKEIYYNLRENSNDKDLLKSIINTNLLNIFKIDFNSMNYDNFESFCEKVGLVLSGSVMLKAITGNHWALENNDNQNDYVLVNDLDTYIDHNYNPEDFNPDQNLLSKYVKDHNLAYSEINLVAKCKSILMFIKKVTSDYIKHFLFEKVIKAIKQKEHDINHNVIYLELSFDLINCINRSPLLCYTILTDLIYMYKHLIIKDQKFEITDDLEEQYYNCEYDNYDLLYYPKIVIDLFDIISETKLSVIIPCHSCKYEFSLYDFKFLGISKDYRNATNQLRFNDTIPFIMDKNINRSYQHVQIYNDPKENCMLNSTSDDDFQLNINISIFDLDLILPLTIPNINLSRFRYVRRIKNNCIMAYRRMLKYYKRGFYTFTMANINSTEFLSDIENLTPYYLIENHISDNIFEDKFNKDLRIHFWK